MDAFGMIAHNGTIRFERRFEQSVHEVWSFLTQPRLMATWLADTEIQIREGGYLELCFGNIEGDIRRRTDPNISGFVSRCAAPQSLAFWWTDANTLSNVTFELETVSTQVLFLLTHGGLPWHRVARCAASWHAHLDMLCAALHGKVPTTYGDAFGHVIVHYEGAALKLIASQTPRPLPQTSTAK